MEFSKRKKSVLIAAIAVCFAVACIAAGQASQKQAEKPLFSTSAAPDKNPFKTQPPDDTLSDSLHKMTLAVLIVLVLGAAAIYASKKVLPKLAPVQGKKIRVIETIHLGSRKTVHLLEVAGQQILIGSTPDRITKLADIFSEKGFPFNATADTDKNEVAE